VSLTPKPLQTPIPTFVATSTVDTVKLAADHATASWRPAVSARERARHPRIYREIAPQGDPKLVLIRFYHLAPTMSRRSTKPPAFCSPSWSACRRRQLPAAGMDSVVQARPHDRGLADRTAAEVRDKVQRLEAELRPRSLILKPISSSVAKQRADLGAFGEAIQP